MDKISFDETLYRPEKKRAFTKMLSSQKMLAHAFTQILTDRQSQFISMYYYDGKKMPQIAKETGVNKSTVSRTISRGMQKLRRFLNYYNNG